jgi:Patatin-like phospholipase
VAQGEVVNRPAPRIVPRSEGTSLRHLDWRARLQYLYLLRVPILIAITIFLLPIVSLHTRLKQLLGNLFVVRPWNIFWTMVATEMLVLGLMVVYRVVLLNGEQRFGIPQAMFKDVVRKKSVFVPQLFLLPMFYELVFSNVQGHNINVALIRLGIGFLGIVAALVAAFGMLWLSVLLSPRYPNPDKKGDPNDPPHNRFWLPFKFMQRWIDWAFDTDWLTEKRRDEFRAHVESWPDNMKKGYLDPGTCLPYPGQLLTAGMLVLSYLLYQLVGYFKHDQLGLAFGISAITYVVLLLIFLNWLLSVAAFYLDYFLVPLLLPALLFVLSTNLISLPAHIFAAVQPFVMATVCGVWLLALASFWFRSLSGRRRLILILAFACTLGANLISTSDHFYEIRPDQNIPAPAPSQVLSAPFRLNPDASHPHGRLTLVATAGGGIQAAAWTAQVLTGLQKQVHADTPSRSFANSIAAISSVSGGAVGTMFFVDRYQTGAGEDGFPAGIKLEDIVDDAQAPALDDVAWAMVYPDLTRAIIPFSKLSSRRLIDRGWALEQNWRRRGHLDATLQEWRTGVADGFRPAVIFNSTIVESGEPLLLTTANVDERAVPDVPSKTLSSRTFSELLQGHDIPVVTAVRLAASFPFVTPASRALYDPGPDRNADLDGNAKHHLVDGGYYDNYGIHGLLQFLNQALNAMPKDKIPDILIVQIRSFPNDVSPPGQNEGWFYQGWAPLNALMNVRTSAQLLRDDESLKTFVDLWSAKGIKITPATFQFQGEEAPLSWQMNKTQEDAIQTQWTQSLNPQNKNWLEVDCFFHPDFAECK